MPTPPDKAPECPVCEDDGYVDIPDEETGGVIGPAPCPAKCEASAQFGWVIPNA